MGHWTNDELIDAFDDVLLTTLSVARDLDEGVAELPTDCPGWSVRDQLAHLVGLEQVLHGAPEPEVEIPGLDHVGSAAGAYMERHVHVRRGLPLCAIADELAGLRPRRIAELRRLAAEGDPTVTTPFGERPMSVALPTRVLDAWCHEQDIRRAVGLPVRIDGPAATLSLERALAGWSAVVPKLLDGHDATVVVRVTAPAASETTIVVGDGGPTATLVGDLGEVMRVFAGRSAPGDLLTGDPDVVTALRDRLGVTP